MVGDARGVSSQKREKKMTDPSDPDEMFQDTSENEDFAKLPTWVGGPKVPI
jgi:hypothetical protein